MPLLREGLIEGTPFALEPDGRGGKAFLAEGVDGDEVVATSLRAGGGIVERECGDRRGRETGDGVFVVAAVHAIDAIAGDAFLGIG